MGLWGHRRAVFDAVLALAVAATTAAGDGGVGRSLGGHDIAFLDREPPLWFAVPLGALVGVAVWRRRRWPECLVVLALAAWVTMGAFVALLLAQYTLAERTKSWRRVSVGTLVGAVLVGSPVWREGGPDAAVPLGLGLCAAPALLGLYVGTRRELVARMRERAERAEREQHQRVLQARSDERAQIARDMHDVVTHRVALMVLHATALEAAAGRDAVAIAGRIGGIGREALTELRSLVQVLRAEEGAPLAPLPGLADLRDLIAQSRDAGTPVTLDLVDESGDPPPAMVGHAVYRVVQEALANVHKHAGGAHAHVRVRRTPTELRLSVTNGRGGGSVLPGGGHGLLGVAERIRLVGGRLTAGPTSEGGFEISAEVPLEHGR
ncbi:histidine kinase [Actinomadura spongiicola]|uniref:histidine kinase n=1 Tax=Actinomadura spongiicola TaxID=2303421 RepID=A0A372G9P5_9ACTN|nr:histidine kinase [Actinomadura spongiicola]RFS82108.1 histidine kinase [Actinomadura spongiicola]